MSSEPLGQVPGPYEDTTCQMVMAYGDPEHQHLETIREFRDKYLASCRAGRYLIDLYYSKTPMITSLAKKSSFLRKIVLFTSAYPAYIISRAFIGK